MEIRLDGKNRPPAAGYKSFSAWVRKTKDGRQVLVLNLGELKISVYPFDRYTICQLGEKLKEIGGFNC